MLNHYFKYADDTALVGMLSDDETDYRSDIDHFVSWLLANCLEINVVQTKELVIDFRSGVHHPTPININGQHIETVHPYTYLDTTIDDKLRWDDNTMNLYKKGQQILYFLRKLNALHIERNILFVFHDSFVKSVMTFGLVCWWGNLSVKNKSLCAVHPIPVWSNCTSQEHCKWQPNSYLTPPTSYTTITTFSTLEGGTQCQK